MSTWVGQYMHLYNFFVCGPKFTRFLLSNLGGVVIDNYFSDFDLPTRSGDIRDQSRKLSEVAPTFGRFFVPPKF